MHRNRSTPAVLALAALCVSGCGAVVPTAGDGTVGDGGSTSSGGETVAVETGNSGPSTSATTAMTTTGPPPDTFPMETGDSSSGGETTGAPELRCPEDGWPNDGSEIIDSVVVSSVTQWAFSGDGDSYYTYLSDESALPGEESRGLRADELDPDGFGVLLETMSAQPFVGQRVRMRAWVARSEVEKNANIWLRVDGAALEILDNGTDRPGYATSSDWVLEDVVLDVPLGASQLVFGSLLIGPGTILVNNPTFEIVSEDVPTTQPNLRRPAEADVCLADLGPSAEELVHIARTDAWAASDPLTSGVIERDHAVTFEAVPTAHLSGVIDGLFAGYLSWSDQRAGQRLRLSVPVRAEDFAGEVRLVFITEDGESSAAYQSEPIVAGEGWGMYSVVARVPEDVPNGSVIGVAATGSGDLWLGYGRVEQVGDDVPLSEPLE